MTPHWWRYLFPRSETPEPRKLSAEDARAKHWLGVFESYWSGKRGWR